MRKYKFELRDIRKKIAMTQVELSQRTGLSQQNISAYEIGKNIPLITHAKLIADALGVKVDDLIVPIEKKE